MGIQNAAVLMLALGQNEAAEVLKFLSPSEVEKLGTAMSSLKNVTTEELNEVLQAFKQESSVHTAYGIDSEDYIRDVLTKALGDDKGNNLLNRILVTRDSTGIDSLKWMDGKSVAELIRNEHPQVIATVLVHLEPLHASEVLTELPDSMRSEVVLRMSTMDGVKLLALNELNDVLARLLTGNEAIKGKPIDGVRATASILNFVKSDIETQLMSKLHHFNPTLARQVTDQMFVFDDIVHLEDRDLQKLLRNIPQDSLVIALKGAKNEFRDKIFKNMTTRAADMLREDFDAKGPVRLSDIDHHQKVILQIVRQMADDGRISLLFDKKDYLV
ncbi:MAG: flagellar motor switch protein FliG [Methylococcaceae bacterium]|nr:flagellar motor switch protein FliG [Methylococcaceae bacterium]